MSKVWEMLAGEERQVTEASSAILTQSLDSTTVTHRNEAASFSYHKLFYF